jgi:hypothetical protein
MDKLKLYAAPLVALILVLLWFVVVQPKINAASEQPAAAGDKPASGKKTETKPGEPDQPDQP